MKREITFLLQPNHFQADFDHFILMFLKQLIMIGMFSIDHVNHMDKVSAPRIE